jgi:hypothetical protein
MPVCACVCVRMYVCRLFCDMGMASNTLGIVCGLSCVCYGILPTHIIPEGVLPAITINFYVWLRVMIV